MPFVSATEALNLVRVNVEHLERELGPAGGRRPLVGTDALRVVLLKMRPGEHPHPPHLHPNADEVFLVLRGSARFAIGDEPDVVASAGMVLYVPRGTIHGIEALGTEPMLMLSVVAPNQDVSDEAVEP